MSERQNACVLIAPHQNRTMPSERVLVIPTAVMPSRTGLAAIYRY